MLTVLGAGIGFLIGHAIKTDEWAVARFSERGRISSLGLRDGRVALDAGDGRVGLALVAGF